MLEFIFNLSVPQGQSQWPSDLRLRSAAVQLLRLRGQILPVTWMSVSCEYFVLLGTGLCDGADSTSRESYHTLSLSLSVTECDRGTSLEAMAL